MKKTLDATGLNCPLPVIETKKALKDLTEGTLEVIVDNTIALQNLEKMAKQLGLDYELKTLQEDKHRIIITAGAMQELSAKPAPVAQTDPNRNVVVLASNKMGSGDDELGRVLMNSFVYALTELEQLPGKVLLYNSGVKLSVHGSEVLGDLQKLAQQGVELLSCGTCLDFYGITDQLGVGSVTNMYEIVQSSMEAQNIIQP